MENEYLLEVNDLHTSFNIPSGEVRSVNGVSFNLKKGEVLGIVGESGSGKSVTAYSVMQILDAPGRVIGGSIKFKGQELLNIPLKQLQEIRGSKISIIFQDSMSSLNPVWTIGNQLMEVVKVHNQSPVVLEQRKKVEDAKAKVKELKAAHKAVKKGPVEEEVKIYNELFDAKIALRKAKEAFDRFAYERALEMIRLVGLTDPEKRMKQYPFEHSGGMLQRVMIAMALILEPDVIIADEPTTALDVTIQAQILELLLSIQKKMGMGIIIITHDLGVVAQVCDKVNVMYAGRVVESGTVEDIFYNPQHEYTKGLINSIPKLGKRVDRLIPISGNPVDVFRLPSGCSFAPRCEHCMKICLKKFPKFLNVSDEHKTACFKYVEQLINEGKMSEEEYIKYIDSCEEGNKAFSKLSRLDVEKAYQLYLNRKLEFKDLNKKELEKKEYDIFKYRLSDSKREYQRVKHNFALVLKDYKTTGLEKLSIDKNDLRKKVKHHKVEISSKASSLSKEEFEEYLADLVISTTPVKQEVNEQLIAKLSNELLEAKKASKGCSLKQDRQRKIQLLHEIDVLKDTLRTAKNDLYWKNYVNTHKEKTINALKAIFEKKGGQQQ